VKAQDETSDVPLRRSSYHNTLGIEIISAVLLDIISVDDKLLSYGSNQSQTLPQKTNPYLMISELCIST
jgi:hypothetical protein